MRKSRQITLGGIKIGGGAPVSVQSMTNTDTRDTTATIEQAKRLIEAGCEIIRVAVPDESAAEAIRRIADGIDVPLVADIHFNYRLAVLALENGADGLRINPGNIGARWKVEHLVKAAMDKGAPIRIGVNAGSLAKELLRKYGGPSAQAMAESALGHVDLLESLNFTDIKISMKASSVSMTVEAYRLLADKVDYPLHVGVTEAGTRFSGTIKSAVGIGALLLDGIGDTLRVSLTDDPVEEIAVAQEILKAVGLRNTGVDFISCPSCGRSQIDLVKIACDVEKMLADTDKPIKVAVMGCEVNGPGEAREADIGLAGGGDGRGVIFRKGKIVRRVDEKDMRDALMEEVEKL